jgi:hypothetical protein
MMTRTRRRFSALVALLALLFMQLSLAAHACPLKAGVGSLAVAAAMDADGTDQDPELSGGALCDRHCLAASSIPTPQAPILIAAVAAPPIVQARAITFVTQPRRTSRNVYAALATAPPPVAVRNCRLLL